jgi:hypothetical protein
MKEETFKKLKEHKFNNGLRLSHVASFAIWDKNNPAKSKEEIENSIDKLNGQYVFVGLNFGGSENLPKDTEKLKDLDWKNFHNTFHPNGGDLRIREVLEGTKFEGAYITDIVKNYAVPQAEMENWNRFIREHPEHLDWFVEEISLLDTDNIKMYLFGRDVENAFIRNRPKLYSALKKKVKLCQRIEHFSPSATNFLPWAPVQLGLKENDIGAKIYNPVWEE